LTSVEPSQGPVEGGTDITLTGTNFTAGATVNVGANPATGVVVVNATTITCTTPAGAVGAADVSVTTAGGTASLAAAFTYNPSPTITTVEPDAVGAVSGGMHHTITGTGFVANGAGPNTVTIGGNACTNLVTVDDTTITCDSPTGTAGATTLVATNNNGSASSAFTYFDPIWGAEGGGCTPTLADCTFFVIDPASGNSYTIGPIGFGVTGMFYTGGTLYGTTSGPGFPRDLITIDPMTGVGTLVGPTDDALATNHLFRDATFDINLGLAVGTNPCELRSFDTSGLVGPIISPVPNCDPGGGIAQDGAGTNIYFMMLNTGPLYTVNTSTGVFTPGPILSGSVLAGVFGGSGFHNGTLYTVESDATGGNRQLHSVNTTTGVLTPEGSPLPSWTSAIVSPTRGTPVPPPAPTLTSVEPTEGPVEGGTGITLIGTNFVAGATVTVGGNAATDVVVVDATTIACTAPAGAAGPADVSVTTTGGTASLTEAFTYNPLLRPCNSSGAVGFTFAGAGSDPDCIVPGVCLDRGNVKGLFNSVTELGMDQSVSPEGTLWADSTCASATALDFVPFAFSLGGGVGFDIVGTPLCLWLTNENLFYDIVFSEWGSFVDSNFAYTRTAVDADECGVATATCDSQCGCPNGWVNQGGDGICVLPDPCATNPCGAGATCRRTGATTHRCECDGVTFTKPAGQTATVDCVSAGVCLARGDNRILFNSLVDSEPTDRCEVFFGPSLTGWALAPCAATVPGDFDAFCSFAFDRGIPSTYVGIHACLNTTDDGALWDIQFTDWCSGDGMGGGTGGCFSYLRWRGVGDGVACAP
jgi:hypothetical protein